MYWIAILCFLREFDLWEIQLIERRLTLSPHFLPPLVSAAIPYILRRQASKDSAELQIMEAGHQPQEIAIKVPVAEVATSEKAPIEVEVAQQAAVEKVVEEQA